MYGELNFSLLSPNTPQVNMCKATEQCQDFQRKKTFFHSYLLKNAWTTTRMIKYQKKSRPCSITLGRICHFHKIQGKLTACHFHGTGLTIQWAGREVLFNFYFITEKNLK